MKKDKKPQQNMQERRPVLVVLGHVDHGKTTLLDTIRKTNVASRESGGITQHVGAYVISHKGREMTVLDTPGHEAFSAMRSRGAKVADIAVLVVAADDGVKPQTKESIETIRAAGIPFAVVINKIDKNNADIDRTKTELTEAGVLLEGWGGDTPNVEISAKTGDGLDALLDLLALVADVAELEADPDQPAQGVVIEAHRDAQKGIVATFLVKKGTLKVGDALVCGAVSGKLKAMEDFTGKATQETGPSLPAVVLGLSDVPTVGDEFRVAANEAAAQEAAKAEESRRSAEHVIAEGAPDLKLPVIVKADVQGSLEAILGELEKLKNPMVAIHLAGAETGEVTENDAKRAQAISARIFAFRVKVRPAVVAVAERGGVQVASYDVIYEMVDAVKTACESLLPRNIQREDLGAVELLGAFKHDPPRQVIGGRVRKGVARKGAQCEAVRQEKVVARGEILELQQTKIPVDEVAQNHECGMLVKWSKNGSAAVGDMLQVFLERVDAPTLWPKKK